MEIGDRFGRLVVELIYLDSNSRKIAKCRCDCGMITNVYIYNLLNGYTTSCGCYHKEVVGKMKAKIPKCEYNNIVEMRNNGFTYESIGKRYGVSKQAIKYIYDKMR